MSFEDMKNQLSSKSKLLLNHFSEDEKENTFEKLMDRSDFNHTDLTKALEKLNDLYIVSKYYDT